MITVKKSLLTIILLVLAVVIIIASFEIAKTIIYD